MRYSFGTGSIGDALWWATTTVTTINADLEAITFEGRVLSFLLRVYALGVFGFIAGAVASYFIARGTSTNEAKQADVREEVVRLQEQVADLKYLLAERGPPRDETGSQQSNHVE